MEKELGTTILIQEKGNPCFKLTIAEKETRLKIKRGSTPEDIERVRKFVEEIDKWIRPYFTLTLRGYIKVWRGQFSCSLHYGRQKLTATFLENPFKASPSTHWDVYRQSTRKD